MPFAEESFSESSPSDSAPTPPESHTPIPEVVVKEIDDVSDVDATTAQKDAHKVEAGAAEAELDHVLIRSQAVTPLYAETAAEVADSAAILDREASPAPLSDEEAGHIGERRLSATPIPEVALTAAEVADSAAIIDKEDVRVALSDLSVAY